MSWVFYITLEGGARVVAKTSVESTKRSWATQIYAASREPCWLSFEHEDDPAKARKFRGDKVLTFDITETP